MEISSPLARMIDGKYPRFAIASTQSRYMRVRVEALSYSVSVLRGLLTHFFRPSTFR